MINAMPKYVGSTTLAGELEWNATLFLEENIEAAISKVKHEVEGELFMHGDREEPSG